MFNRNALSALCIAVATANVYAADPAPQESTLPGEGSLYRELFGEGLQKNYGITISGLIDATYARNNRSTAADRQYGQSNIPVVGPGDEGLELANSHLFIDKRFKGTFIPRIGPLPGPQPTEPSFGFTSQVNFGRNSQSAGTFGWDKHWNVNSPGDNDTLSAKRHHQEFVAIPNLAATGYVPYGPGVNAIVGIFGPAMGYEIPPNVRLGRNAFASKTYAFVTEPGTVAGFMLSSRVMNNSAGIFGIEGGLVQGWSNLRDNNDEKSLIGALRYRTPDMQTWVDYEFIVGDEQNDSAADVQAPVNRLISPDGQLKQQHSLNGWHAFDTQWSMGAELVYGHQAGDGKASTVDIVTGPGFDGAHWWGANAVVTYQYKRDLGFSVRAEHFDDPQGFALFPASSKPGAFNEVTAGLRYDVNRNLSLRPEVRYDWFDPHSGFDGKPFVNGSTRSQLSAAVEALIYF